jgi:hypothetical protein
VKRERSSADKIKAGLDGLSKQAVQSNEIRRDALVARLKLIDHTVSSAIPAHEQAFMMLTKEYSAQLEDLEDDEFDALPLMLEQPIRQGTTFSTLGTTKGKHLCMLPPGPRRDQFVQRLLNGISTFIVESNKPSFGPGVQEFGSQLGADFSSAYGE